jgi:hypothetical protein
MLQGDKAPIGKAPHSKFIGGRFNPRRTPASNPTRSASCISPNILCRLASALKTSINTGISRQTSAL